MTIRKFKCCIYETEDVTELETKKKDLFVGHLNLPLIQKTLRFDDVIVKTIYCFLSSLESGPEGGPLDGSVWVSTFCTVPVQDLVKSPFRSTHKP